MAKKHTWGKISNQICVKKEKNSLLELQSCLKLSSPLFPWHMHAQNMEDEDGWSLIRMVMVDYSKKNSISVYANISPEQTKYLYHLMQICREEVFFFEQKIVGTGKGREGIVTRLTIQRHETDTSGKKRERPWQVEIQNGTGVVAYNSNGGQFCEKGSYKMKKKAVIFLEDFEIFCLFCRANAVVEGFERDALFHRRDLENFRKLLAQIKKLLFRQQEPEQEKRAA